MLLSLAICSVVLQALLFCRLAVCYRSPLSVTSSQWSALNSSVGGRLFVGAPFPRPCFPLAEPGVGGSYNESACSVIQSNYTTHSYLTTVFGGYTNTNFGTCQATGLGCLLNASQPTQLAAFSAPQVCHQGSVPSYYIDVTEVSDIQAAFTFVGETEIPLVIKNTGHDYLGRSSAPNSLALWTHNLAPAPIITRAFVPDGCPEGSIGTDVVTVGAGQQLGSLYQFALENNITVVGGTDSGVGIAGGYTQGGGHSVLSNTLGMGADRALQFKTVTPDGVFRTINRCQNTDLFWALRGGGGGTFGVVTELTTTISPVVTLEAALITIPQGNSEAWYGAALDNLLVLLQSGYGGFIDPADVFLLTPSLNRAQATAVLQPLINFANTYSGSTVQQFTIPSFTELFETFIAPVQNPIGIPSAVGSRLITSVNLKTAESRAALVSAIMNATAMVPNTPFITTKIELLVSSPFSYVPPSYDNISATSVNPAWRNAVMELAVGVTWDWNTSPSDQETIYEVVTSAVQLFRDLTPGGGAYTNEADLHEPAFSTAFWGNNYERLLQIKKKYDPRGLLNCYKCVGYNASDPRFGCYI